MEPATEKVAFYLTPVAAIDEPGAKYQAEITKIHSFGSHPLKLDLEDVIYNAPPPRTEHDGFLMIQMSLN